MKATTAEKTAQLAEAIQLSESVIYLMGLSFVLGSLFTVLVLLLLDFMRRDRANNQ